VVDGEIVILKGGKVDFEVMQERSQVAGWFEIERQIQLSVCFLTF
jgi:hypothetical protein